MSIKTTSGSIMAIMPWKGHAVVSGRRFLFLLILSHIFIHVQAGNDGFLYPDPGDLDDDNDVVYNWPVDDNNYHKAVNSARNDKISNPGSPDSDKIRTGDESRKRDAREPLPTSRREQPSSADAVKEEIPEQPWRLDETKAKVDRPESFHSNSPENMQPVRVHILDQDPESRDDKDVLVKSQPISEVNQNNHVSEVLIKRQPNYSSNQDNHGSEVLTDSHSTPSVNQDNHGSELFKPYLDFSFKQDDPGSDSKVLELPNEQPRAERLVQESRNLPAGKKLSAQLVEDDTHLGVERRDDRLSREPTLVVQDSEDTRSYCSNRPGETCCTGRNDACSVPYHDTLCYCDIFCDRSGTDCCPDFVATCGALVNKHLSGGGDSNGNLRELGYRYPDDSRDNVGGEADGKGFNKDHDNSKRVDMRENPKLDGRLTDGLHDRERAHDLNNPDKLNPNNGANSGYGPNGGHGGGRSDWEYDEGISEKTRDAHLESGTLNGRGDRTRDYSRDHQDQTLDGLTNNCYHRGRLYQPNDEFKENCNNCTCVNAVMKSEYNWKCTQKICLIRPELLQHIADHTDCGWQAQNYSFFWGLSAEEGVRYKLGTLKPTDSVNRMTMLHVRVDEELPVEFDARIQWPGLISPVMDQGYCAASWAFSTTGVASDRLRIHSGGVYGDVTLSAQHLISCDNDQSGCTSGHVDRAWWFMRKVGIVSEECYPYENGNRKVDGSAEAHHGSSSRSVCLLPRTYETLKTSECPRSGVQQTVYRASPPYKIAPNEREIMKEIMTNGPVQAIMEVKEDFYMYKSGVYSFSLPAEYQTDNQRKNRYHSVRIIGWGVDRSGSNKETKYWLIANSWGRDWGEDGYFRILRGADESSIESHVVGVWLKVNDRMLVQRHSSRGGGGDRRSHNRGEEERRSNRRDNDDERRVRHPRHHGRLHQHAKLE